MRRANALKDGCEYDDSDPAGYRSASLHLTGALDAGALAVKAFELPPGEALCPYHYEYEEEWLIVLEGTVTVRTPDGEERLEKGDVVAFPAGPAGAHKVLCAGEGAARVIMFSSAREPAVAIYPDSDKVGVWPGGDEKMMFRRGDGGVDYWDGES
ncbi:MAG TPA: cupin domain-containing protein [Solirubrobacteraceae bacterium]|jgi:uncharacterized cupin superfamily protein